MSKENLKLYSVVYYVKDKVDNAPFPLAKQNVVAVCSTFMKAYGWVDYAIKAAQKEIIWYYGRSIILDDYTVTRRYGKKHIVAYNNRFEIIVNILDKSVGMNDSVVPNIVRVGSFFHVDKITGESESNFMSATVFPDMNVSGEYLVNTVKLLAECKFHIKRNDIKLLDDSVTEFGDRVYILSDKREKTLIGFCDAMMHVDTDVCESALLGIDDVLKLKVSGAVCDVEHMEELYRTGSFERPVVVDKKTNTVIYGDQLVDAFKLLYDSIDPDIVTDGNLKANMRLDVKYIELGSAEEIQQVKEAIDF